MTSQTPVAVKYISNTVPSLVCILCMILCLNVDFCTQKKNLSEPVQSRNIIKFPDLFVLQMGGDEMVLRDEQEG